MPSPTMKKVQKFAELWNDMVSKPGSNLGDHIHGVYTPAGLLSLNASDLSALVERLGKAEELLQGASQFLANVGSEQSSARAFGHQIDNFLEGDEA